jgi:pimeloyl-ACP methyl ester carboxylesterase
MIESNPCGLDALSCCPATTPATLGEALARFEREAVHGVCDTGRYRCTYFAWGQGPPLLLIHGVADDARSFVQLAAKLTAHFRCIAYNLPTGIGDGAHLNRYTHQDLVADVFAMLDHLECRRSYVLGSSFGSTIALEALRTQPERLPRAILQGGFARRELTWAEYLLIRLLGHWPGPVGALPLRKAALRRANARSFGDAPAEVWAHFFERSNTQPVTAVAHRAMLVHRLDLRPMLAKIQQPVLLVAGDHDRVVDRSCDEVLAKGLPNTARVELVNCGHNPLFSHPHLLAEVVRRFLTPPGGAN